LAYQIFKFLSKSWDIWLCSFLPDFDAREKIICALDRAIPCQDCFYQIFWNFIKELRYLRLKLCDLCWSLQAILTICSEDRLCEWVRIHPPANRSWKLCNFPPTKNTCLLNWLNHSSPTKINFFDKKWPLLFYWEQYRKE